LQCVEVCCSVLQCVAVCCSVPDTLTKRGLFSISRFLLLSHKHNMHSHTSHAQHTPGTANSRPAVPDTLAKRDFFSITIGYSHVTPATPHTLATYCNALQRTATHCNTLQRTATHCNTLQHTATHCNTLQNTATHCNTLIICDVCSIFVGYSHATPLLLSFCCKGEIYFMYE